MNLDEIKRNKIQGDFVLAGRIIGITPANAAVSLERVNSKRHKVVKEALEKIIKSRESLVNN